VSEHLTPIFGLPVEDGDGSPPMSMAELLAELAKAQAADKVRAANAPPLATVMREVANQSKGSRTVDAASALTIITSDGAPLTKTWLSPAEKPAPVKFPYRYRFEEREPVGLGGFTALLREIEGDPYKAIIRGRLKPGLDPNEWHRRLSVPCPKTGDPATVEDVPRNWVMVDIDTPPLSSVDELQTRLPRELRGVNYVGQLSSTTGHPILGGKLKMHAWFLLDRALSSAECRTWLGACSGIDASMLTPVGIHFTAAPVMGA
jgi:hypothetical protein